MPVVAQAAIKAKVPVYVGADSMVADGGLATYGINYVSLGKETAKMVIQVLEGKKPGDIPVLTIEDVEIYINEKTAQELGVEIPEEIKAQAKML